jgi:hypothetical protein
MNVEPIVLQTTAYGIVFVSDLCAQDRIMYQLDRWLVWWASRAAIFDIEARDTTRPFGSGMLLLNSPAVFCEDMQLFAEENKPNSLSNLAHLCCSSSRNDLAGVGGNCHRCGVSGSSNRNNCTGQFDARTI